MKNKNFTLAMDILSRFHTTQVVINHVEPNGQVNFGTDNLHIAIVTCCAGAINELREAGFSLSMHDGLMHIQDYAMK